MTAIKKHCTHLVILSILAGAAHYALADNETYPAPSLPVLDDLLSDVDYWEPVISPNGERVAGVRRVDDRLLVVISNVGDENPEHEGIEIGAGRLSWLKWVSDKRLIMMVAKDFPFTLTLNNEEFTYSSTSTRVIAMDYTGENLAVMFEDSKNRDRQLALGALTNLLPDDPDHVLMPARKETNYDLYKVNVNDGTSVRVAKAKRHTIGWFADDDGTPAFRYDTNYWRTALKVYASTTTKRGKTKWKKIRTVRRKDVSKHNDFDVDFEIIASAPAEHTYYVKARPDGYNTVGIHVYDRIRDEYVSEVKVHPEYDILHGIINEWEQAYIGAVYVDDRFVLDIVDKRLRAHLRGIDKYFGESSNVYPIDSSKDGLRWLLAVTGPTEPGSYYSYDVEARHVLRISGETEALEGKQFSPMQVVKYTARDGTKLTGYLTRPVGTSAAGNPPLIVMPHGGPEERDSLVYDLMVQLLAAHGYQVFQPNFRGSSGYGQRFADAGRRQWGKAMQHDVEDGFHHLVDNNLADKNSACIVGGSYGGYSALFAATRTPDLYQCAVSYAGVFDLPEFLRHQLGKEDNEGSVQYWSEHMGSLKNDLKMLEQASPARYAHQLTIPVLLLHGENDRIVPIAQSELMAKAIEENDESLVSFIRLEDFGHGYGNDDSLRKQFEEIMLFLTEHLPTSRPYVRAETQDEPETQSDSLPTAGF